MSARERVPSPIQLRLLGTVLVRERNGREILADYLKEFDEPLSIGTLYTTMQRMLDDGWVRVRADADEDGRFRWFRATASGTRAFHRGRDYYGRLSGLEAFGGG